MTTIRGWTYCITPEDMKFQDQVDRLDRAYAIGKRYAETRYDHYGVRELGSCDQLDMQCRVAGLVVSRDERSALPQPQPEGTLAAGPINLNELTYQFQQGFWTRMRELLGAPDFIA